MSQSCVENALIPQSCLLKISHKSIVSTKCATCFLVACLMMVGGLFDSIYLSQSDLKLLYPPDNLYKDKLTLALQLTGTCAYSVRTM